MVIYETNDRNISGKKADSPLEQNPSDALGKQFALLGPLREKFFTWKYRLLLQVFLRLPFISQAAG